MRKRTIAIIAVLVLFGSILVASNVQFQTIGGIDIDYDTQIWRTNVWRIFGFEYKKIVTGTRVTDNELLDEEYITSWLDDGRSEKISLDNTYFRIPIASYIYKGGWWQVDIYKDRQWKNIFDDDSYDDDYVCDISGNWGLEGYSSTHFIEKTEVIDPWIGDCICKRCGDAYEVDANHGTIPNYVDIHFDGLSFRLKGGGYNGYLRVRYMFDGYVWEHEGWKCSKKNGLTIVEDFARLKTGEGDIRVLPNSEAPSGASEYFEEGQEVTFEINTGYDGSTGTNWVISINDNYGNEVAKTVYDTQGTAYTTPFSLKNGLTDKKFSYTVQDGEWVSGDENRWVIHLYNSILEKDREDWYIVYKGAFNDLPGLTDVTWLSGDPISTDYYVGDTIQLKTTALPNSNTQRPIEKFEIWAYIENKIPSNIMYHGYESASASSGDSYSATFEIPVDKEGLIVIEARAWDSLLPGGTNIEGVYILPEDTQDFYDLYVLVVNNKDEPISDALVEVSNEGTLRTGGDGEAIFSNMPEARYEISASYPGMGEDRTVIYLDSNRDITMKLGGAISIINIIITILVGAISILAIWFIPHPLVKKFRIPLIVVISIICIFIYLFLSGMLVFIS